MRRTRLREAARAVMVAATVTAAAGLAGCDDDDDESGAALAMPAAIPASFVAGPGDEAATRARLDQLVATVMDGPQASLGLGPEAPAETATSAGLALQGFVGQSGVLLPEADELEAGADCDDVLRGLAQSIAQLRLALTQTTSQTALGQAAATPWYTKEALPADPRFSVHERYLRREPTAEEAQSQGALAAMLPTSLQLGLGATGAQAALELAATVDVDFAKLRAATAPAEGAAEAEDEGGGMTMTRMVTDSKLAMFVDVDQKLARTSYAVQASVSSSRGLLTSEAVGSTELTGGDLPRLVVTTDAVVEGDGRSMRMAGTLSLARNADGTLAVQLDVERAGERESATATLVVTGGACTVR